mmetsp:Transcript_21554/g.10032  ORF Transcript_21554/g.10032 Transcript_21554/m.10032 type:complete len:149 (-) Transcript_21554:2729-3175(-)
MRKKVKKRKKHNAITSFLCPMTGIEGLIEFEGTIRLDGKVKGNIRSLGETGGTVIIGEEALIEANLEVGVAIVMGEVRGDIFARERIEIYPPCKITGDIIAPIISIDPGAVFNGKCSIESQVVPLKKSADDADDVEKTAAVKMVSKII